MKKVFASESIVTINHYKNVLTAEGIPAFIKNEHLGSIIGEMPFVEVWPELWIENDLDYNRAKQLLDAQTVLDESPGSPWRCAKCGEENEAQFGACWSCGATR